jgi:hypothetical protein
VNGNHIQVSTDYDCRQNLYQQPKRNDATDGNENSFSDVDIDKHAGRLMPAGTGLRKDLQVKRSRNMFRYGVPLLLSTLGLVIAIVWAGTQDSVPGNSIDDGSDTEYQVEDVTIESVEVQLAESFPVQVFVNVSGYLPDPCWEPREPVVEQDGSRFNIEIVAERKADQMCPQVIEPYESTIGLGTMEPGDYLVDVNGLEQEFEVH